MFIFCGIKIIEGEAGEYYFYIPCVFSSRDIIEILWCVHCNSFFVSLIQPSIFFQRPLNEWERI